MTDKIPKELECIDIVWREERWFVAGTFNRRLCMYRLLALFLPDKFRRIQVRRKDPVEVRWHLRDGRDKFSTECLGDYVQIRWGMWVGKDWNALQWREASDLHKRLKNQGRC